MITSKEEILLDYQKMFCINRHSSVVMVRVTLLPGNLVYRISITNYFSWSLQHLRVGGGGCGGAGLRPGVAQGGRGVRQVLWGGRQVEQLQSCLR